MANGLSMAFGLSMAQPQPSPSPALGPLYAPISPAIPSLFSPCSILPSRSPALLLPLLLLLHLLNNHHTTPLLNNHPHSACPNSPRVPLATWLGVPIYITH